MQKEIQDLLDQGMIQLSRSEYAAPIVIVRKKTGESQLCVDYRRLNQGTLKDRHPIPNTANILDSFSGSR